MKFIHQAAIVLAAFLLVDPAFAQQVSIANIAPPNSGQGSPFITYGDILPATRGGTPGTGGGTTFGLIAGWGGTCGAGQFVNTINSQGVPSCTAMSLGSQAANTVLGSLTASPAVGLNLPSCSGASSALTWTSGGGFGCNTFSSVTVNAATTGNIAYYSNSTTVIGSTALPSGTTATTQTVNTSNTTVATTAFANPGSTVSTNGYQILPGGAIIEWGVTASITSAGSAAITFPFAFPTGVYSITSTPNFIGSGSQAHDYVSATSATGFTQNNVSGGTGTFNWMAIGH